MRRRSFLATVSSSAALVAGCSALSSNTTKTTSQPPTVQWTEEYIDDGYRVSVSIELNSADQVQITDIEDNSLRTVTDSGTYTIAGPSTEYGLAMMTDSFTVEQYEETLDMMSPVSTHVVGSQVTPEISTPPLHLVGLSGSTDPNLEDSGTVSKTYQQEALGSETRITLSIPEVLTAYYTDRLRVPDYGVYVSDTYDDPYLEDLVGKFETYANERDQDDLDIIRHMMSFVQNLEYTTDRVGTGYNEYPKFPIETLADKDGDCEDTCILLASLLNQFGYATKLLLFREQQHMAVGIGGEADAGIPGTYFEHDGVRYYYLETTSPGWGIGEAPDEMQTATPEIAPVDSSPVIVFSYVVQSADDGISVDVGLQNAGDAPGTVVAQALFEDQSENVVTSDTSASVSIPPQERTTVTLHPSPPGDETLRAKIRVEVDGTPHDLLTSEYQTPLSEQMDS